MATLNSQLIPIEIKAGVQPSTDRTALSTQHFTMSDKIRFYRGRPQKLGGWQKFTFSDSKTITGVPRTLYGAFINNQPTTVIGTESYLYAVYSQDLYNITPLQTATNNIPDSLETDYNTLANDPITTVDGSNIITVADTQAALYREGDYYTLAGSTSVNGIPDTDINVKQVIRSIGVNEVTIMVSTEATSSGSGGGASVVRATGLIRVLATAHGQVDGDRVKITDAATTGGIADTDINAEFIIRNKETDTFDIFTDGTATSSVTSGGGASTKYQKQLPAGGKTVSYGIGYGVGDYGVDRYGTSRVSSSGLTYPQTWILDRFGDRIVGTPGNQGGVYIWDGSTLTAPSLLTNAPTTVNYIFVSDNILVTLGYDGVPNQIFASDQGDATQWTASSLNQVYQDVIEGADKFISHVPVLGINLLFTKSQTYRFSKIDINAGVWETKLLDNTVGIIGPMARVSVNNVAYWMANNNFYMWDGGNVSQMPSNTDEQSTILRYVYDNINTEQAYKSFAWYNDIFNEIWFHYPSASSDECDRIARVSLSDFSWCPDTMDRTCAEYPDNIFVYPRLISSTGDFYNHELGNDDDTSSLAFTLTSNLRSSGKETALLSGFVPDSIQTGDISVNLKGFQWPQTSSTTYDNTFTVEDNAPREDIQIGGRYWKYTWSGDVLGQKWVMGQWYELAQKGSAN